MTFISKEPLHALGYGFITEKEVSGLTNEYDMRNQQLGTDKEFRQLTAQEIQQLTNQLNYSSDWSKVWVSEPFFPEQIQHSKFYGLVRIGAMEQTYLSYRDLRLPTGIYNSTIVSSDIGACSAIHHVRYMAHFIIGEQVLLSNINEMETSNNAKFGNGILKEGESPDKRIWMELCNENGGRSVVPFDGMQAADVYLWSRHREDSIFQNRLLEITDRHFSTQRGYYSTLADNVVLKNSNTIKDVKIGPYAYIKGVNKLKNVTVNSSKEAFTQIGEGCEIVNGIIGYGCRVFYGVKAVRFILSSHSQLKYGARLINSFLGDNSTISCCEVLNSLLFPSHEQHHNNSFLCAALIKGQSNMAAGATIGSNHNSRAADGEIIAGRGFWPGLCVSIKHNSKFASYTLLVKGDFLHELDIRIPFSLVSNEADKNRLLIVPGYWFLYNMYALMRNTTKFNDRDKRTLKNQYLEYDVLAPDTVNEMFDALHEIEMAVGQAWPEIEPEATAQIRGRRLLMDPNFDLNQREVYLTNTEFSNRKVVVVKARACYHTFKRMIHYYGAVHLADCLEKDTCGTSAPSAIPEQREQFENVGGQLIPQKHIKTLIEDIKTQKIDSWTEVHERYHTWSKLYPKSKIDHALASLAQITETSPADWDTDFINHTLAQSLDTKKWIYSEIKKSRGKDYENPFRMLTYNSKEEMEKVVGKLEENSFLIKQQAEFTCYEEKIAKITTK
ncbi:DUF4954 family protein [Sphingobacterium paucimobilis]|uniref:DUF4954 domain-containing protein n=1 Tax=Sphingobacterium paucimobilis HER1398 TaxID=1346330 RepID=U2IXU4_9SPHI|nr:DUF4954 family protein [Sphingobacterium paucimobilis]ERJ57514.1 hypothetical protein M472_01915 [Sphingobacterium paucimobilis HER1398]